MVNYTSLGYESLDEYNIDFFGTLLETNHTYEFFVNWEKVFNNLKDHLIEISILNSLNKVESSQVESHFREILKLVQKYVLLKKQGYIYSTRFKDTERLIQTIISSNNPKLCLQIRNGESKLHDFSIDRTIERGYYCPNASITHILHTKISRELEKAFVSSHDKRKREILLEKKR